MAGEQGGDRVPGMSSVAVERYKGSELTFKPDAEIFETVDYGFDTVAPLSRDGGWCR